MTNFSLESLAPNTTDIGRPVTALIGHIKCKGPSSITKIIFTKLVLTISALDKTSFSFITLPESAAVYYRRKFETM